MTYQVDFEHENNVEGSILLSASHRLTQVPSQGDFVTFHRKVYRVTAVLWDFGPRDYPLVQVTLADYTG